MAKIRNFENIESWKKARSLTKEIYKVTSSGSFARDFGLKDQMRRASVSILSNIAEGFERGGDKEFVQYLAVANLVAKYAPNYTWLWIRVTFLRPTLTH